MLKSTSYRYGCCLKMDTPSGWNGRGADGRWEGGADGGGPLEGGTDGVGARGGGADRRQERGADGGWEGGADGRQEVGADGGWEGGADGGQEGGGWRRRGQHCSCTPLKRVQPLTQSCQKLIDKSKQYMSNTQHVHPTTTCKL